MTDAAALLDARAAEIASLKRQLDAATSVINGAIIIERDLRKRVVQATAGVKSIIAGMDEKSDAAAFARLVLKRLEAP